MKYFLIVILLLSGCASVRPWTTEEKLMLGASCIATFADGYTTIKGLHDGCSETNPITGKNPSDGVVISFMAITQGFSIIVAHYWEEYRMWLLGMKTGVNAGFAWHNARTN